MNKILFLLTFIFQTLPSFSQKDSEFKRGSYYDLDWKEHKGFVHYNYNSRPIIKFKEKLEDKAVKLKARKISGFTIEEDLFLVMYGFSVDQAGFLMPVSAGFVEVVEEGKLTLYRHYSSGGGGMQGGVPGMGASAGVYISRPDYLENYLLKENDSDELIPVIEKKKHFIQQMSEFFGGYPEILEKIESGEWGFEDMPEIVKFYNSYPESGSVKRMGSNIRLWGLFPSK